MWPVARGSLRATGMARRMPAPHHAQKRFLTMDDLDRQRGDRERVVILGSGWGGYPMSRELDLTKFQPVIVSPRSYFVFTPLLASTSTGSLEFRNALEPIRSRGMHGGYIQAWANDVDFYHKTVTLEESVVDPRQALALVKPRFSSMTDAQILEHMRRGRTSGAVFDLAYDKLVIAVGCYAQTFNTPGVREHALFLKDVGDARRIRKRLVECFETAALPTTPPHIRQQLLNFAVVGGGPTGIEFAAELHDICKEDLTRMYPELAGLPRITVYDVAPRVLSMFDDTLARYAADTFRREGIDIKTSRHVQRLTHGLPGEDLTAQIARPGLTLSLQGEGDVGVGMCVWSTGLAQNPFVKRALSTVRRFPARSVLSVPATAAAAADHDTQWHIRQDERSGSIVTDARLRVTLATPDGRRTAMADVFAIGDCGVVDGTAYPATAQVANQKGRWLARMLNRGTLETQHFNWKNLGVMAYIGNWKALVQSGEPKWGSLSGRAAWIVWRGAYLMMALSWKNRIMIFAYWVVNYVFGRDISRF